MARFMSTDTPIDTIVQRFTVPFEYPVSFTHNVFDPDNPLLAQLVDRLHEGRPHRIQAFIDSGVLRAYPDLPERIAAYCDRHAHVLELVGAPGGVPGGEEAKNSRDAAERVMESIADNHLCRQSYVLAIGGGSVLDIVGLAAALVHRGLRLIRVATTVLAQNDSAVGVKNGIDAYGVKNFAGTFVPPFAVIADFAFLDTLADKYWIGGLSEAYKVAIINDASFFAFLQAHAAQLRARDRATVEESIRRSALLHLAHIRTSGDPFEFGTARPLDFGHWSAHKIEILSGYEIGHGQAVAIGIAIDTVCACRMGLLTSAEQEAILAALQATGLPIWSSVLERRDPNGTLSVLQGIRDFQEHLGGTLNIAMPNGIGCKTEVHELDTALVLDALTFLKQRTPAGARE